MFSKINSAIVFAASVALFYLYKTETDIKSVSAVSYVFRDINRCELFHVVTQADTVSAWFRWVKHFRSADEKPVAVGKLYQVYYDSEQPVIFRVVHYDPFNAIVLESDCLLKPRIELRTIYVSRRRTKLLISIQFRRASALFQFSLGPFLKHLSREKLLASIKYLKLILRHKSAICRMTNTTEYC